MSNLFYRFKRDAAAVHRELRTRWFSEVFSPPLRPKVRNSSELLSQQLSATMNDSQSLFAIALVHRELRGVLIEGSSIILHAPYILGP